MSNPSCFHRKTLKKKPEPAPEKNEQEIRPDQKTKASTTPNLRGPTCIGGG